MHRLEWPSTFLKYSIKPIIKVIFHGFVVLNLFHFHCDLSINLMMIPRYKTWHSFGLPCVVFLIGTQTKNLFTFWRRCRGKLRSSKSRRLGVGRNYKLTCKRNEDIYGEWRSQVHESWKKSLTISTIHLQVD